MLYRISSLKLFGVLTLFLIGCSDVNYQVISVESPLMENNDNELQFENKDVEVLYNFWSDKGRLKFFMKNKTDEILYVDLKNSFFIKNNVANDYYVNKTKTYSTKTSGKVTAVNNEPNVVDGRTIEKSSKKGLELESKKIIAIPPTSGKHVSYFNLRNTFFDFCDFTVYPKRNDTSQVNFNQKNTPLTFKNFITYSFSKKLKTSKSVSHSFWVENVMAMTDKTFFVRKEKPKPCKPQEDEGVTVIPEKAPNKFFIEYGDEY
jgi:hypothetical protein